MWKSSPVHPRGIRRLFRLPATRERLLREADDEMRMHLEMWADDFRSRGMSDEDARAAAVARFGDPRAYRDHAARRAERQARWQAGVDWVVGWAQDVRFALRHFAKAPAFTDTLHPRSPRRVRGRGARARRRRAVRVHRVHREPAHS